jgi:sulfoxide reductase catalytic subunit YedY
MLIKKPSDIKSSEITDQKVYLGRRRFLLAAGGTALAVAAAGIAPYLTSPEAQPSREKLAGVTKSPLSTDEPLTPYEDVTNYNNFYEFGTDKYSPAEVAKDLRTKPWTVTVEGECHKPAVYQLEDLLKPHTLEERIYRLRCVEGWSMVIPWVFVRGDAQALRAHQQSAICGIHHPARPRADARPAPLGPQMALCGRLTPG